MKLFGGFKRASCRIIRDHHWIVGYAGCKEQSNGNNARQTTSLGGNFQMKICARYLMHTIRKWNVSVPACVIALGIAMCCSNALAQSGAGSIQGTVTDPSGAVIAGSSVHVVNQTTSVASDTKTNDVGFYQGPGLFTGTYVVTISAPGMKTYNQTVDLLVSQTAIVNPVMAVGAVSQQVNVAANAVQLTGTADGTITSRLENAKINQLPMNGRLDGVMPEALLYVADGAPLSDRNYGGEQNTTQDQLPDPDSIQEVHRTRSCGLNPRMCWRLR
jgi:hypothetical protein